MLGSFFIKAMDSPPIVAMKLQLYHISDFNVFLYYYDSELFIP